MKTKKKALPIIIIVCTVLIALAGIAVALWVNQILPMREATIGYNQAVDQINLSVRKYNTLAKNLEIPADSVSQLPDHYDEYKSESISYKSVITAWINGARTDGIITDTNTLNGFRVLIDKDLHSLEAIPPMREALGDYNKVAEEYNQLCDSYNSKAGTIDVEGYLPDKFNKTDLQDTGFDSIYIAVSTGDTPEKVKADTNTLNLEKEKVADTITVYENIVTHNDNWIYDRILCVDNVESAHIVTRKEIDDMSLFDKESNIEGCVYFRLKDIKSDEFNNLSVLELGTKGGGAVEAYKTLKEAQDRCDYLKTFDNSILESGSYSIFGTMVIRLSHKLSDQKRLEYTEKIIERMCEIPNEP